MNMYQFLEQVAKESPDALYLVREKITFKEVLKLIHARATTLHNAGVRAGDVVGLLSHNIPEFPITLFAIWYLGGTVLLLDTNLTPFEYDNMTKTVGCKFVCAEKSFFYKTRKFKFFDIETKDDKADTKLKPAKTVYFSKFRCVCASNNIISLRVRKALRVPYRCQVSGTACHPCHFR